MAYLTFDASTYELYQLLIAKTPQIEEALRTELPELGVDPRDIVFRILDMHTAVSSEPHVEIILKTDSPKVTSPDIVRILAPILDFPFEVTRIPVGYGFVEWLYELRAYILKIRRNWASNYGN